MKLECAVCATDKTLRLKTLHRHIWLEQGESIAFWEQDVVARMLEDALLTLEDTLLKHMESVSKPQWIVPGPSRLFFGSKTDKRRNGVQQVAAKQDSYKVTVDRRMIAVRTENEFSLYETKRRSAVMMTLRLEGS